METWELVDKDRKSAGSVSVVPVPVRRLEFLLFYCHLDSLVFLLVPYFLFQVACFFCYKAVGN